MTTTVKLDPDVERMLQEEALRLSQSLNQTLNDMLRTALQNRNAQPCPSPYPAGFRFLELREGIDPLKIRQYADELADQEFIEKMNARQKAKGKEPL